MGGPAYFYGDRWPGEAPPVKSPCRMFRRGKVFARGYVGRLQNMDRLRKTFGKPGRRSIQFDHFRKPVLISLPDLF